MKRVGKVVIFATLLCGVVGIISPEDGPLGPLHRAKRYSPYSRAPLAFMNKLNQDSIVDDGEPVALPSGNFYTKRFLLGRDDQTAPLRSHFRELRLNENHNAPSREASLSSYPMLNRRNTRRFGTLETPTVASSSGLDDINGQLDPLTDEELQTILLLLDGYALSAQGGNPRPTYSSIYKPEEKVPETYYNPNYLTPDDLRRVARMYKMGKRESSFNTNGQFHNFDDSDDDSDRMEFLTPKRSKRVGGAQISGGSRFKKETDPKVEAELERAFSPPRALPLASATTDKSLTHDHKGPTAAAASGQIPTPGGPKAKKSIDWSQYFGIDKKSGVKIEGTTKSSSAENQVPHATSSSSSSDSSTASPAVPPSAKPKVMVASRITEPSKTGMKESKEHKKLRVREENETENKSDRKWILNEFYKNLAMATNVKRKREISKDDVEDLSELEQKMQAAGDEIIWDALKYTGAHKDEPLSPIELAQVKKDIIEKLATAYNLEKIREAIDNFREQLLAIKTNNV